MLPFHIFFQCDANVPEIVPQEYWGTSTQLPKPEDLEPFQHPVTLSTQWCILADRFHSSQNPHKSPLCRYHDIDKCLQSLTIKTSYQEIENSCKNQWKLPSPCAQSFGMHFLFNYLMNFYHEANVKDLWIKL